MLFERLSKFSHVGRLLCTALLIFLVPTSYGQVRVAYAWADQPAKSSYEPHKSYRYNSAAGAVSIARHQVGKYSVTFNKFGTTRPELGSVQVTAYGTGSAHCKVRNWNVTRSKFVATVDCYNGRSRAVDSFFTVLAMLPVEQTIESLPSITPNLPVNDGVTIISKEITSDGNYKEFYSDGSNTTFYSCGYKKVMPDGQVRSAVCNMSVPALALPEPLPENSDADLWVTRISDRLLDVIANLVGNDEETIANYLAYEGDVSVFQKLDIRTTTLQKVAQTAE